MIVQNIAANGQADISFTVHRSQLRKAMAAAEDTAKKLKAKGVEATEGIAKVSIVGDGMRGHAGIASQMFKILAEADVKHPDDLDLGDQGLGHHRPGQGPSWRCASCTRPSASTPRSRTR